MPYIFNEREYNKTMKKFFNKYKMFNTKIDNLYDVAVIGYVEALNSYDRSKGTKFETHAFNCMRNKCLKEIRKENAYKRTCDKLSISINNTIGESNTAFEDIIADENIKDNTNVIDFEQAMILIEECLSELEYSILNLVMYGYSDKEAALKLHIPIKTVASIRQNFKFNSKIVEVCFRMDIQSITMRSWRI